MRRRGGGGGEGYEGRRRVLNMEHESAAASRYAGLRVEESKENRRIDESPLIKPIGPRASALKNSRVGAEIQGTSTWRIDN